MTDTLCEKIILHGKTIKRIKESMPSEKELSNLSELFKVFGDSTRIKILYTLSTGETCVCDIAESIKMTQSAISHQLKILKQSRLIKSRKDGKSVFYSLDDEHINKIISAGLEHISEDNI